MYLNNGADDLVAHLVTIRAMHAARGAMATVYQSIMRKTVHS